MECPRCGEDNLPGLPACMGCGQDLSRPRVLPEQLVPRASAGNPLDRRTPTPRQARRPWVRFDAQLGALGPILAATLWGLVPGLGALQRGERKVAVGLAGAALLCGVLWLLLWTHPLQVFLVPALLSVIGSSILTEQRARLGAPGIAGQAPGVLLALSACLLLWGLGSYASELAFPRVRVAEALRLPDGHYLVRPVTLAELQPGTLVAVGEVGPRLLPLGAGVELGPVIALPGQRVQCDDRGEVLIDGAPPTVPAINPGRSLPMEIDAVPPGHVVVLRRSLEPVPVAALGGALWYRWLPQAERGPVPWPPDRDIAPSARIEVLRE